MSLLLLFETPDESGGVSIVDSGVNNNTTITYLGNGRYRAKKTGGSNATYGDAGAVSVSALSDGFICRLTHINDGTSTQWAAGVTHLDPTLSDSDGIKFRFYMTGSIWYIYIDGGQIGGGHAEPDAHGWMWRYPGDTKIYWGFGATFAEAEASPAHYVDASVYFEADDPMYFDSALYGTNEEFEVKFYDFAYDPITVTGSPSLDPFTSSGIIKTYIEGVGAGSLNSFVSTGDIKVRVKLSGAPSLSAFTGTGAIQGVQSITATGSPVLDSFTTTGTIQSRIKLSGTPSLSSFISTGNLDLIGKASGTTELNSFGGTGIIKVRVKVSGQPTLAAFTGVGVIETPITLSGSGELGAFTSQGTIKSLIKIQGYPELDSFTSSGNAEWTNILEGAATLDPFTSSGEIKTWVKLSGNPTLGEFIGSGTVHPIIVSTFSGSPVLNTFTGTGTIKAKIKLSASVPLNAFIATGRVKTVHLIDYNPNPIVVKKENRITSERDRIASSLGSNIISGPNRVTIVSGKNRIVTSTEG